MKRFHVLFVAALFGAAFSLPAQFRDRGNARTAPRGKVVAAQQNVRGASSQRAVRSGQIVRDNRRVGSVRGTPARQGRRPARQVRSGSSFERRSVRQGQSHRSRVVGRSVGRTVGRTLGRTVGRWVTRCERVLVPGFWDQQHVPAVRGWVYDRCGRRSWGIVQAACFERVWIPARWENRERRVWVSGCR
ncbi:MAG: hypothetical protein AB8H80_06655 [Planctomycetota bacterium]